MGVRSPAQDPMTSSADPSLTRPSSAFAAQVTGARAHPRPALVATVSGLVNGTTMVVGAIAVGWATDHLIVPALSGAAVPASAWWGSALAIIGISAVRWTSIFVRGIATGHVQYRAQAETRRAVVRRYLELDSGWHRRRSTGQLLAHAVSDVDALWTPMQWAYFALSMVFMLLIALVDLFVKDVAVGCIGGVLVLLVLGLNLLYQRLLAPRTREGQAARAEVASIAHESIEGGPVVRSLGLSTVEVDRFSVAVERVRLANTGIAAIGSVFDPVLELLPTAAVLGVLAVGAPRVASGALTVGDLVGVVYLLLTIAIPLNVISRFISMLPLSSAGLDRVHSVLSHPAVTRFGEQSLASPGPLHVALRGAGVVRGGHTLLDGIDLDLPSGTVTAVVGHVGSGKTTLLDLATGHAAPSLGVVSFDSVDVRELTRGMVAQNVAVVSQSPFLFAETIRENLTLSGHPWERRDYTEDELWSALRLAAADDVVRDLPAGLDTVVGGARRDPVRRSAPADLFGPRAAAPAAAAGARRRHLCTRPSRRASGAGRLDRARGRGRADGAARRQPAGHAGPCRPGRLPARRPAGGGRPPRRAARHAAGLRPDRHRVRPA